MVLLLLQFVWYIWIHGEQNISQVSKGGCYLVKTHRDALNTLTAGFQYIGF